MRLAVGIFLVLHALPGLLVATTSQVDWAADVRYVRDELLRLHPKLSHGKIRDEFSAAATALAERAMARIPAKTAPPAAAEEPVALPQP